METDKRLTQNIDLLIHSDETVTLKGTEWLLSVIGSFFPLEERLHGNLNHISKAAWGGRSVHVTLTGGTTEG